MTWLAVTLPVAAALTFLALRAILHDRHQIQAWRAERETAEALIAYHARRSQEIRQAIDELGDDAQYLFPPARNGR